MIISCHRPPQGGHDWITTDICCAACYALAGLAMVVEVYLSQVGDITLVRRDLITGDIQILN